DARRRRLRSLHDRGAPALGPPRPAQADARLGAGARRFLPVPVDVLLPDQRARRQPLDALAAPRPARPARLAGGADVRVPVRVAGCDSPLFGGGGMNGARVAWLYLKVGVLNELQYRVNFFVNVF